MWLRVIIVFLMVHTTFVEKEKKTEGQGGKRGRRKREKNCTRGREIGRERESGEIKIRGREREKT